jgi:PBP1b-binding outer membrane lipoprotein LpoB
MKKILLLVLIFSMFFTFFSCADATKEVQPQTFPAPASVTMNSDATDYAVIFSPVGSAVVYNVFVRYEPSLLEVQLINTGKIRDTIYNTLSYLFPKSEINSLADVSNSLTKRFGVRAVSANGISSEATWATTTFN